MAAAQLLGEEMARRKITLVCKSRLYFNCAQDLSLTKIRYHLPTASDHSLSIRRISSSHGSLHM